MWVPSRQFLPESLLISGILPYSFCQSLLQHWLSMDSSREYPSDAVQDPLWTAGGALLHRGPPQVAGGQPASPCSWMGCEHLLITDLGVCRAVPLLSPACRPCVVCPSFSLSHTRTSVSCGDLFILSHSHRGATSISYGLNFGQ